MVEKTVENLKKFKYQMKFMICKTAGQKVLTIQKCGYIHEKKCVVVKAIHYFLWIGEFHNYCKVNNEHKIQASHLYTLINYDY